MRLNDCVLSIGPSQLAAVPETLVIVWKEGAALTDTQIHSLSPLLSSWMFPYPNWEVHNLCTAEHH